MGLVCQEGMHQLRDGTDIGRSRSIQPEAVKKCLKDFAETGAANFIKKV